MILQTRLKDGEDMEFGEEFDIRNKWLTERRSCIDALLLAVPDFNGNPENIARQMKSVAIATLVNGKIAIVCADNIMGTSIAWATMTPDESEKFIEQIKSISSILRSGKPDLRLVK